MEHNKSNNNMHTNFKTTKTSFSSQVQSWNSNKFSISSYSKYYFISFFFFVDYPEDDQPCSTKF